jgi:hypothetical protein
LSPQPSVAPNEHRPLLTSADPAFRFAVGDCFQQARSLRERGHGRISLRDSSDDTLKRDPMLAAVNHFWLMLLGQ